MTGPQAGFVVGVETGEFVAGLLEIEVFEVELVVPLEHAIAARVTDPTKP